MSFASRSAIFTVPLILALLAPAHDVEAAQPLLRARLNLDGLATYMKDRAPKEHAQIAIVRAMGLSEVRIAILPDDDRIIVPVVSVTGNKAVLRNLLTAKESPIAKVLVSKGENRYQLQYGSKDTPQTLDLTLTEHGDSLVLSLPDIDAATRTAAIARTALLEQGRDRFIEVEFDVPEDLELDGLRTVFDKYGVSKEPMARIALMSVGMMLGQMLEPFESIDRLAGGVFIHSAGLNIVDVALVFNESEVATTTHAMLSKKQPAPRRFRGIVELANDERLRSKLTLTNETLSGRYGWSSADELELAKLLERAMRAVTKREMVANEGSLASTPHEQRPLALPIDTGAWQKEIAEAMKHTFAKIEHVSGSSGPTPSLRLLIDPPLLDNLELLSGTVHVTSILSTEGDELKVDGKSGVRWDASGVNLTLPVKTGASRRNIARAKLRLDIVIPEHISYCDFVPDDPADTIKNAGSAPITLGQLKNNVAEISTTAKCKLQLEAYDAKGQRLAEDAGRWNNTEVSRSFHGTIARARAIAYSGAITMSVELDLPLEAETRTKLAPEAVDKPLIRFNRQVFTTYPTASGDAMDKLQVVQYKQLAGNYLKVYLHRPPVATGWEFHAFGENKPAEHRSQVWSHRTGATSAYMLDGRREVDIRIAFGRAMVEVPVECEAVTLKKVSDGEVITKTLASGDELKFVFDKNTVLLQEAGKTKVLSFALLDDAGRRLATSNDGERLDVGRKIPVWGIPTTVTIEVSPRTARRVIEFEKTFGDYDAEAYKHFKASVAGQREIAQMVKKLLVIQGGRPTDFGDNLASLHYLHGREDKPLNLITAEVAHADPVGAKVFGYTHKPWKGYRFILPQGETSNGEEKPHDRDENASGYTWAKGKLESRALRFGMRQGVIAIPVDPTMPTFVGHYSNIYAKTTGDTISHYQPDKLYKWQQYTLVE